MSANPECQDQDRSSRRTLPQLRCCEERAVADTPRHSQYQNDPESSLLHLEGVGKPVCPSVVAQPDRQRPKASTPLACESHPTTKQLQVPHGWIGSSRRKRSLHRWLAFPLT